MVIADTGAAIRSGWSFWKANIARAGGAVGLYTLAGVAVALAPALGWPPPWSMGLVLLQLLLSVMAHGALYRLALEPDHRGSAEYVPGPLGLQWRKAEWRLTGALLLILFFCVLVILALSFLALLAATAIYVVQGAKTVTPTAFLNTPGGLAVLLIGIVGVAALVWTLIRLSLAMPATVDSRLVQVFGAWGLTQGRVLDILAAAIVVGLPTIVLTGIVAALRESAPGVAIVIRIAAVLLASAVQAPIMVGVYTWFYRAVTSTGTAAVPHN